MSAVASEQMKAKAGISFAACPAVNDDTHAICALVNQWASRGLTLARIPSEIADSIHQFVVVKDTAKSEGIAACGSLVEWPPKIAEIRSVAVSDAHQGCGAGRAVVEALIAKARADGLDIVVLLTKAPEFFAKQGFESVPLEQLPAEYVEAALVGRNRCTQGRTAMRLVLEPQASMDGA